MRPSPHFFLLLRGPEPVTHTAGIRMMTEIIRARLALNPYFSDSPDRTAYHFKRHAIQNCIYGVDIDHGAVEIAKLNARSPDCRSPARMRETSREFLESPVRGAQAPQRVPDWFDLCLPPPSFQHFSGVR
jgi:hypothetical protein